MGPGLYLHTIKSAVVQLGPIWRQSRDALLCGATARAQAASFQLKRKHVLGCFVSRPRRWDISQFLYALRTLYVMFWYKLVAYTQET